MKKVGYVIGVILVSFLIIFLGFTNTKSKVPNSYYQVYLDGEQLGTIKSKRELETYIDSQADIIRDNVRDYETKINAINDTNEVINDITDDAFKAMSTKDKVNYLVNNKNKLNISDSKYDNIKYYNDNKLWNLTSSDITDMNKYYEENKIYLESDKIYTPNGIEMKKVLTYEPSTVSTGEMYKKIISKKNCTIPGYRFTIKKEDGSESYVYVTDSKIFSDSIDTMASIFVGDNRYNNYKDDNQAEIEGTGEVINNVYVEEDIAYKAVNISTDEKIYTDSTELSQYLLYGDNHEETTVTVNTGDSISSIAYNNQISVEEFLISNPEYTSEDNLLYAGKEVKIAKVDPQINIVEEKYSVSDIESNYRTVEVYDDNITEGQEIVTQEGEKGLDRVSQNVKSVNGEIAYVEPVSKETVKNPVDKKVAVVVAVLSISDASQGETYENIGKLLWHRTSHLQRRKTDEL